MSYPRVNLLKKSEQRYQGAVSRRFMLIGIVVAPVLFIAMLSGIKLVQYTSVQAQLKSDGALWASLEPKLELYKQEQRSLAENQRALELVNGWRSTQVPLSDLLGEIQSTIPASIQLSRLAIRSEPETLIHEKPEDFVLDFSLAVQGVAHGERAEAVVIDLRRNLLSTELMGTVFDSVKLGSMRKSSSRDGETLREFSLTGTGAEGEKQ